MRWSGGAPAPGPAVAVIGAPSLGADPYGSSRLKYWLASFGANAWPNNAVKSVAVVVQAHVVAEEVAACERCGPDVEAVGESWVSSFHEAGVGAVFGACVAMDRPVGGVERGRAGRVVAEVVVGHGHGAVVADVDGGRERLAVLARAGWGAVDLDRGRPGLSAVERLACRRSSPIGRRRSGRTLPKRASIHTTYRRPLLRLTAASGIRLPPADRARAGGARVGAREWLEIDRPSPPGTGPSAA